MTVRVRSGARLHFGFLNLSLAHSRLYGSLGVALDTPEIVVEADRSDTIDCQDPVAAEYAAAVTDYLDLPGAAIRLESTLPRHAGLGSGTQLALSISTAIASAYDRAPAPREQAPKLGRGGRSGVGVATFESGGVILDAGHPTERFTTERPSQGSWRVPPVVSRHETPTSWRFVLVVPEAFEGASDEAEDASMRSVVEAASPDIADRISGLVLRDVLPAVAESDCRSFGQAVAEVGRLNGAWYADEQGGVYRPPVADLISTLGDSPAIFGAGQSSWGPTAYGVTTTDHVEDATVAAERALENTGLDGDVFMSGPRNEGASVENP